MSGTGLTAGAARLEESPLSLTLQLLPSNPLAEAACIAAGQPDSLQLPVLVQPSTAPASIVLLVGDDTLPYAVCTSVSQLLIICIIWCIPHVAKDLQGWNHDAVSFTAAFCMMSRHKTRYSTLSV